MCIKKDRKVGSGLPTVCLFWGGVLPSEHYHQGGQYDDKKRFYDNFTENLIDKYLSSSINYASKEKYKLLLQSKPVSFILSFS